MPPGTTWTEGLSYIAGEGRGKHLSMAALANACPGSEERRRVYSEPAGNGKQKYALAAKIIAVRRFVRHGGTLLKFEFCRGRPAKPGFLKERRLCIRWGGVAATGFSRRHFKAIRKCRNINPALAKEGFRPNLIRTC